MLSQLLINRKLYGNPPINVLNRSLKTEIFRLDLNATAPINAWF